MAFPFVSAHTLGRFSARRKRGEICSIAPPKYLDFTCRELIADDNDIVIYCRCGHKVQLTPETWARYPESWLHRIIAKARCTVCGSVGDVPTITVLPRHTGGFRERR